MARFDKSLEYSANTQTLIGEQQRRLIDEETGEVIQVNQITKRVYGTKNFWKVYLMDFLAVLGIFDSKQLDVLVYIAENTQSANNMFIGTMRKIADNVGCSTNTVNRTIQKLLNVGFLKKVQTGVYMINPDILMKGNDTKRGMLLSYYETDEPTEEDFVSGSSVFGNGNSNGQNDD